MRWPLEIPDAKMQRLGAWRRKFAWYPVLVEPEGSSAVICDQRKYVVWLEDYEFRYYFPSGSVKWKEKQRRCCEAYPPNHTRDAKKLSFIAVGCILLVVVAMVLMAAVFGG